MGTNYYIQMKTTSDERALLHRLKTTPERLHLGKSSAGWQFSFQGFKSSWDTEPLLDGKIVTSFDDWMDVLDSGKFDIVDEYGDFKSVEEFKNLVASKREGKNHAETFPRDSLVDSGGYSITFNEFS